MFITMIHKNKVEWRKLTIIIKTKSPSLSHHNQIVKLNILGFNIDMIKMVMVGITNKKNIPFSKNETLCTLDWSIVSVILIADWLTEYTAEFDWTAVDFSWPLLFPSFLKFDWLRRNDFCFDWSRRIPLPLFDWLIDKSSPYFDTSFPNDLEKPDLICWCTPENVKIKNFQQIVINIYPKHLLPLF